MVKFSTFYGFWENLTFELIFIFKKNKNKNGINF